MMKNVLHVILNLSLILSLGACESSDGSSKIKDPVPEAGIESFNTKSCEFEFNEGESADFSLLGTFNPTPSYFNKNFNRAYLTAVSKASVEESIRFINQTGTTVYKSGAVPTKICSRSLFAQGATLPSDLQSEWVATGSDEIKDSVILGLYLPQNWKPHLPSVQEQSAIIVRENTNRWTLVHEFMHHLFYTQAIKEGYDPIKNQSELDRALKDLDSLAEIKKLNQETVPRLADVYSRLVEQLDLKLTHFPLEEMTIEATLKEAHNEGSLSFVPVPSNFYIKSSGEKALEIYDNFEELGQSILSDLRYLYGYSEEKRVIQKSLTKIYDRQAEVRRLMLKYPLHSAFVDSMPGIALAPSAHVGCSHEHESNRLLQQSREIKEISEKFRN